MQADLPSYRTLSRTVAVVMVMAFLFIMGGCSNMEPVPQKPVSTETFSAECRDAWKTLEIIEDSYVEAAHDARVVFFEKSVAYDEWAESPTSLNMSRRVQTSEQYAEAVQDHSHQAAAYEQGAYVVKKACKQQLSPSAVRYIEDAVLYMDAEVARLKSCDLSAENLSIC